MLSSALFAVGASWLAALIFTPLTRLAAIRLGLIARPVSDRWHDRPTAMLGGVAIAASVGFSIAISMLLSPEIRAAIRGLSGPPVGIAASAFFLFLVGLLDDIVPTRPQVKFVLQLIAGGILLTFGAIFQLTPWFLVNLVLTLFWFVGVTNALNLLDNMDGVAAGVSAIAAFFLGLAFVNANAPLHALLAWSIAGAALGFLFYNFHPASIFMGDAGSLFLGSTLAGLAVCAPGNASGNLLSVLFVPITIVAVPILDTILVTVTRTLAGRAISQGGRDHSTHRLVALGLAEPQVAVLLYAFAALGGVVAISLQDLDGGLGTLAVSSFLLALTLLAAYLGRMQVYTPSPNAHPRRITLLVADLLHKKRLAEMLLDAAVVALSFYGAFRLRFAGALPAAYLEAFRSSVALVIALRIAAFSVTGVYRGAWQYATILDVYRIVAGIVLSSVAIAIYSYWVVGLPLGSVLVIDALLTATLVLSARLSFRSLELLRKSLRRNGELALIYGGGDAGELIIRQLSNNPSLGLTPVCILDDDARKHGTQVHGVPIVGGNSDLARTVEKYGITQ
ncbi:MAG TPA: hypothetical protein VF021_01520, partial [Longimicrobiales bacterium]